MPKAIQGRLDAGGLKFAVVVSRFNDFVTERLLDGALEALKAHGADESRIDVIRVPGPSRFHSRPSKPPPAASTTRSSVSAQSSAGTRRISTTSPTRSRAAW